MLAVNREHLQSLWLEPMSEFALCRIGAAIGATRSELVRDLGAYFDHRMSPSEFRYALDDALIAMVEDGSVEVRRGRYAITDHGKARATEWLGAKGLHRTWSEIRDQQLTARMLGCADLPLKRQKMLARPDGLRMAILQNAYGLKMWRVPTPAKIRALLAGIALKRAFGEKSGGSADAGFGTDGGVDAAASRRLAGQLAHRPRDFGTDARLIAVLAAEAIGAIQTDPTSLRVCLFRRYVSEAVTPPLADKVPGTTASGAGSIASIVGSRPDLETFAREVLFAAEPLAEGWSGHRRAFISRVWAAVAARHAGWGLTEIEFKSMLVEAHRTGHISLSNADLKDRSNAAEFQASAITYKNTVWHFIRVES